MSYNANQNHLPERLTPDEERVYARMLDVRRSVAVVKSTEIARGINPEAKNGDPELQTYQVNGNVIDAAAFFAHNKRVAQELADQQQLAKEHDARDAIDEARNPSVESSNNNVIEAAERFQPKAVEIDPHQQAFQNSSRAAVLASFEDSANRRAA